MRVIIIEDEKPAAEKLRKAIIQFDEAIEVLAILNNVKDSVAWLSGHSMPDIIFMDIELTDGLSFRIFDQCLITCPVIFITAYDEYWQEAFEYNSIDYLLKPVKPEKLENALKKYGTLKQHFAVSYQQLMQWQNTQPGKYRKRFLVKRGADYITIKSEDIAYFYATHKLVCMVDNKNQKYILDKSLADLEKEIDPAQFYRANRKYLVNISAIKKIRAYPKSKLLLETDPPITNEEVIISQENATAFKEWMGS